MAALLLQDTRRHPLNIGSYMYIFITYMCIIPANHVKPCRKGVRWVVGAVQRPTARQCVHTTMGQLTKWEGGHLDKLEDWLWRCLSVVISRGGGSVCWWAIGETMQIYNCPQTPRCVLQATGQAVHLANIRPATARVIHRVTRPPQRPVTHSQARTIREFAVTLPRCCCHWPAPPATPPLISTSSLTNKSF